ncbi:hypothetical protein OEZ85_010996 [Tetradesmus obliquus]|uniref:Uracil-DNA glycosylase-like domain-containing protein n=1 Tax=Tetradesmus obliquus TaxID=3088 RepID=A0ABY8TP64_TETOB|nr:hypothetical protein OEZ85_010996 [Tetradesmus obliquus]
MKVVVKKKQLQALYGSRHSEEAWHLYGARAQVAHTMTSVLNLAEASVPTSWRHHLVQLLAPYACTLDLFLAAEQHTCEGVLPSPPGNIFRAFAGCDFEKTCVVILGEPHVRPEWAQGLAYSVPAHNKGRPAALNSILGEVAREFGKQRSPDLSDWAPQGVLLLNTALTCREACQRTSHQPVWEPFIDRVLQYISTNAGAVVFMLWGHAARAKMHLLDGEKHLVLQAAHPAYAQEFAGCNHFAVANNWLVSRRREPVMWV